MKPGVLIQLNEQLCVRQRMSNPYKLARRRFAAWIEPMPLNAHAVEDLSPAFGKARAGWGARIWLHAILVVFFAAASLGGIAWSRIQHRRAEYQWAVKLRQQEQDAHRVHRINFTLAGQLRQLVARRTLVNQPVVQPANFTGGPIAQKSAGSRL